MVFYALFIIGKILFIKNQYVLFQQPLENTSRSPTIHHRPWPRSPALKKAIEEDLTEDQSKLTKHRTCLENLLGKDEVGYRGCPI